jgi:hypothetical protein
MIIAIKGKRDSSARLNATNIKRTFCMLLNKCKLYKTNTIELMMPNFINFINYFPNITVEFKSLEYYEMINNDLSSTT